MYYSVRVSNNAFAMHVNVWSRIWFFGSLAGIVIRMGFRNYRESKRFGYCVLVPGNIVELLFSIARGGKLCACRSMNVYLGANIHIMIIIIEVGVRVEIGGRGKAILVLSYWGPVLD